jgi:hypothetical protein
MPNSICYDIGKERKTPMKNTHPPPIENWLYLSTYIIKDWKRKIKKKNGKKHDFRKRLLQLQVRRQEIFADGEDIYADD